MFTKTRKVVALGASIAVAASGIALATASENDPGVIGKVAPSKLDKKKFKPVALTLGVTNSDDWIDGTQSNPLEELIRISKNVKVDLSKAPRCNEEFTNGTSVDFARAQCPGKSYIGSGKGTVNPAPGMALPIEQIGVFNGPKKNQVQMVTQSTALGPAAPVIYGKIVKANKPGYGQALRVDAPETGPNLITKFQAKLDKARKVVTARCKPKKIKFHRTVTYKDETSESVVKTQNCKIRR